MTTTPNDPRIKINADAAAYLSGYFAYRTDDDIAPYLTPICPECGCFGDESPYPHITDETDNILIGCEGYYLINPNLLGMNRPNWSDWTDAV